MHLNMSSAKYWPFCFSLNWDKNVLIAYEDPFVSIDIQNPYILSCKAHNTFFLSISEMLFPVYFQMAYNVMQLRYDMGNQCMLYILAWISPNLHSIHNGCIIEFITRGATQIAKFMGPTWGPSGSCWPQVGPTLAPWTLLSVYALSTAVSLSAINEICIQTQVLSWKPGKVLFNFSAGT